MKNSDVQAFIFSIVRFCFQMIAIVGMLLTFNLALAQVAAPTNPNSAKSCAICHYRWIDTFFLEGRGSDYVEYTAEKVVATTEMCFSCHDGSIADSRARAYETPQHKINAPPPDHMKIPDIFPLDEKGNMQCSTCHTAHGVPSGPDSKETIFMRTSNRNSAMCRMCHPDRGGGPAAGNHTLDTTEQKIPPDLVAMGALEGDKTNQLICETCHTAHGSEHESYLIKSGKDSSLCLNCHNDKNNMTPGGQKKPVHVVNVIPQKARIPAELINNGARTGDKGELVCQSCHRVHNNKIKQPSLLVAGDERSSLCLTCHVSKQFITESKHNLLHSGPNEKNLAGKTVAQAGVCSACHLPHQPARKLTANSDFATEICLSCHSKGNVAEKTRLTGAQHPQDIQPSREKFNPDSALPLYNEFGFRDQTGKLRCATCHDPHRWRADSPAKTAAGDLPADRTTSFLRQQAPRICSACHGDKFHVAGSKHDMNKVAPAEKNLRSQSPAESGLCGTCHLVHNARDSFLWARKTSVEIRDVAADLCRDCHRHKGLASNKAISGYSHPINIAPSEFGLATSLPLFDSQGKISANGAVSCPTCHDPHRWDPIRNISEDHYKREGSSQNSFLRLENSPSARLCENCHPAQGLIDKTEHDLVMTSPASKNIIGQTALESGTCGVCHLAHNSRSEIRLWAREYGSGNNIMETMCNACHSFEGAAKNKVAQVYLHPREKLVKNEAYNTKGKDNYFPLFHGATGSIITSGNISCPSCHNAHQWNPQLAVKGTGVNAEGDASNSFLRHPESFELCKKCHDTDSQFKIKYYHDAAKRKFKGIDEMFF